MSEAGSVTTTWSRNPDPEHRWLGRLVGEWQYQSVDQSGSAVITGSATVRMLGDIWLVGNLRDDSSHDGASEPGSAMLVLGYNPAKGRFEGSWVASVLKHQWVYEGTLDEAEGLLPLSCVGPSFEGEGDADYRDLIELVDRDTWRLRGQVKGKDGKWKEFAATTFSRKR